MIFTKPETESDEVHVSSYLIFCKLEGKQMCAHTQHNCQLDEKPIDQCDECEPSVDIVCFQLQAHTRKMKNIKAQAAGWPRSPHTT